MADAQSKTEKATPKRLGEARKKGRVPRSRETVTFALLMSVSALFFAMSGEMYIHLKKILQSAFVLNPYEIHHVVLLQDKAKNLFFTAIGMLIPIFAVTVLAAYFGNIVLGGHVFSMDRVKPKLTNIAPKNTLARIFSSQSAAMLLQTLLKCAISILILAGILKGMYLKLIALPLHSLDDALSEGVHDILITFLMLSFSTFIYVLIDYPYQFYLDKKNLKMSKQEVREEHKNAEGNPQMKRRVRVLQRQALRKRKSLRHLADADLVITNPTHYAVALQYDEATMDAPVILALGANMMALHIRRVCTERNIPILEIPLLARALYYHGEIGERIPEGLFYAVARVIAYIFRLDDPLSFQLDQEWVDDLPIPEELTKES